MNKHASRLLILAVGLFGTASLTARAQITVDGNLDGAYGSALATQTVNTGFGNSTGGDGAGGSELDAGYGVIQGGNLYLFLAGDFENNGNHLNVFVSGGSSGQSTLSTSGGTLAAMNGSTFSSGFQATYAFDMNDYEGTLYNEEYVYGGPGALSGGYVGAVAETSTGMAAGTPSGGSFSAYAMIGLNNTHVSTMGTSGAAANQAAANAVTTGFEMEIPLAEIGYTGGAVEVVADINGGGDTYLSNQSLPGLATGSANLGTATFNDSGTPGDYFTVPAPVPEPSTLALGGLAGVAMLVRRHWRK